MPDMTTKLGSPLSIREVARMIGSSAWTVRQKYVPRDCPACAPAERQADLL